MITNTIEISRSLLQKALRRADLDMTHRIASYLIQHDFDWVRNRLAILTFEECWTYGVHISYESNEKVVLDHILKLAGTIKNRNAAGLGSLAHILSEGDESVFDGSQADEHLRSISTAIKNPTDFWERTRKQSLKDKRRILVENAYQAFGKAEQPWDKAFTQAAAHLAITEQIPETMFVKTTSEKEFPLWIAIDKHTRLGTLAITQAAEEINVDAETAMWLAFYFEGVNCNATAFSPWWEREKVWRMKSLALTMDQGEKAYDRLRPIVVELLTEETEKLRERIFEVG